MVRNRGSDMKLAQSSDPFRCIKMVNKPPKPPCWRDFLTDRPKTAKDTSPVHFSDLSQMSNKAMRSTDQLTLFGLSGTVQSAVTHAQSSHQGSTYGKSQSVKSPKKHRNKLHRTRSEVMIEQQQIPDMNKTMTLAETKPREFGLRKTQFNAHVYIQENTRRCERWLEDVRASRPLEDVHFAHGTGVELEIPDEESLVVGHTCHPDVDSVSMVSVDYLRETQSLPRTVQSYHKPRALAAGDIREDEQLEEGGHVDGIVYNFTSQGPDIHHGHSQGPYQAEETTQAMLCDSQSMSTGIYNNVLSCDASGMDTLVVTTGACNDSSR